MGLTKRVSFDLTNAQEVNLKFAGTFDHIIMNVHSGGVPSDNIYLHDFEWEFVKEQIDLMFKEMKRID